MNAKCIWNDPTILEAAYIPFFSSQTIQKEKVKYLSYCHGQAGHEITHDLLYLTKPPLPDSR